MLCYHDYYSLSLVVVCGSPATTTLNDTTYIRLK